MGISRGLYTLLLKIPVNAGKKLLDLSTTKEYTFSHYKAS